MSDAYTRWIDAARQNASPDAPLTPAEAMARCPEVAALVEAGEWTRNRLEMTADKAWQGDGRDLKRSIVGIMADFDAALAPFTKGSDE